ncbi:hypothetical protein [Falsiroseomonas sp. HW251]|uniref:hypothetical protein n=1 Tax=Falsiroseomonas sp. HW251 TaxID=3390998 RepID=UPI003D32434B
MSPARARAAGLVLMALVIGGGAAAQTRPGVVALEAAPVGAAYLPDGFLGTCCQGVDGLAAQVNELLRGSDSTLRLRLVPAVINGQRLDWYDPMAFLTPHAAQPIALARRPFDIAVLDECLACAEPTRQLRRQAEAARRSGAEPVILMPWAASEDATARIAEAVTRGANAVRAYVVPAGLAFARARAQRPATELLAEDGRTPTQAGGYLAAAIVYVALYGRSPEGNAWHGGLDEETAGFLQRVAWETAWDYYAASAPPPGS